MSEAKKPAGKAKAAPPIQDAESVVYVGPDIPGSKQYTVFINGLPDALKEKIKEHPFCNSFVVPVGKLAQANAELAQEESALSILFRKARGK